MLAVQRICQSSQVTWEIRYRLELQAAGRRTDARSKIEIIHAWNKQALQLSGSPPWIFCPTEAKSPTIRPLVSHHI
jgi:hypothetical protein